MAAIMSGNQAHMDVQYSPSKWSTRMCACRVIEDHLDFIRRESKRALNEIPNEVNISYGDTESEKLDIFGVDLPDDAPICFYVHGGFWQELSKNESSFPALSLYQLGIKTFVIDYALCPDVTMEIITKQIQKAFKFTLSYATKYKSRGVHLMGHSAGAHLVAYLLGKMTNDWMQTSELEMIQKVVLLSGVYNLRPIIETYVNDKVKMTVNDAVIFSLLSNGQVDGKIWLKYCNIQIFVVIAEQDSPAFHDDSTNLYKSLKNQGGNVAFVLVTGKDHFDMLHFSQECVKRQNCSPIIKIFDEISIN